MSEEMELPLSDLEAWKKKHPHITRGKHYVKPRGYAGIPGTGPENETCQTCTFARNYRRYWKCEKIRRLWTHGRGSDILARSPACNHWEKKDEPIKT